MEDQRGDVVTYEMLANALGVMHDTKVDLTREIELLRALVKGLRERVERLEGAELSVTDGSDNA